jgi:hypothetical protein
MKINDLLGGLRETGCFKSFMKENPGAFFAAGFFVLDDSGEDKYQLDFYIPEKKKIATSEWPFKEMKIHDDLIEKAERLKVVKVDICDLRGLVEALKQERGVKVNTIKIIALLKDDLWQLTCLSDGLDMLRINIDAGNREIKRFEKTNVLDFVKKI